MGAADPAWFAGSGLQHFQGLLSQEHPCPLREKLVLHRGWHRLVDHDTDDRPLENTREAYLDAVALGVACAECDVWATSDGQVVLSHDASMGAVAEDPSDPACGDIGRLPWDALKGLRLKGGSTPVLLRTVLEDLVGSGTRLFVELKSARAAAPLAGLLNGAPELRGAVACVISFSFSCLEAFHEALEEKDVRTLWLLSNPTDPYPPEVQAEGEMTFHYERETFAMFIRRSGNADKFRQMRCGLHVQYNPCLTASHVFAWRADLAAAFGDGDVHDVWSKGQEYFIGIWSDRDLDPGFDCIDSFRRFLEAATVINTDLPATFGAGYWKL